jgi:hypothetical protein
MPSERRARREGKSEDPELFVLMLFFIPTCLIENVHALENDPYHFD